MKYLFLLFTIDKGIRYTSFFVGIVLLASCSSQKLPLRYDYGQAFQSSNYTLLNGTYANIGVNKYHINIIQNLWQQLDYHSDTVDCSKCQVQLILSDEHNLTATLLSEGQKRKELHLKGYIQNNSFILEKQRKIKFLAFILVWGFGSSDTQLTLDKQNQLLVDNYSQGLGMILIAPGFGASSAHYDQQYVKLGN